MRFISVRKIHIKQQSLLRKRRRYNKIHKILRYQRSIRKRFKISNKYHSSSYYNDLKKNSKFEVPSNFNLYNNTDEVIRYINSTKEYIKNVNYNTSAYFDLSNVTNIDNGGIGLLLCLVNFLSRHRVTSMGNLPKDVEAKNIFVQSGFFEHVDSIQGKKQYVNSNDVFIVQNGHSVTNPEIISHESRKVMLYITGEDISYKPMYSIIGEIMSNSIEHANQYKNDKNWLVSAHYEPGKVTMMAIDIGEGILSTMRKKISQKIADISTLTSDIQTLYNLFDRKYQSSTMETNRNKGLPKIKECYENGYISNLNVITNKVFLDFGKEKTRALNVNFNGTFYYFEITIENINKWKNRLRN